MNSIFAKTYPKPARRSSGNRPLFVSINCLRSAQWCFGSWSLLYLSTSQSVSQDPSIIFNFENSSESTFCICFCYFLLRAATRPASPEPGDVAGLQKGSEGWIGLRENNIGKNCINSRNFSIKVQNSEKIKWFKDWSFQKMHYQCGITNIDYVSIQLWPVKVCLIFCFNFKYLCKVCAYLTANTFESGPMPTPWKFLDSLSVIPRC